MLSVQYNDCRDAELRTSHLQIWLAPFNVIIASVAYPVRNSTFIPGYESPKISARSRICMLERTKVVHEHVKSDSTAAGYGVRKGVVVCQVS